MMAKISATSPMGGSQTTEKTNHRKAECSRKHEKKVDDDGCVHTNLRRLHRVSPMISPLSPGGPFDSSQAQCAVVLLVL